MRINSVNNNVQMLNMHDTEANIDNVKLMSIFVYISHLLITIDL